MAEIKELPNVYRDDAKKLLQEALEMDWSWITIVGQTEDQKVHNVSSSTANALKQIGGLEMAKFEYLLSWKNT